MKNKKIIIILIIVILALLTNIFIDIYKNNENKKMAEKRIYSKYDNSFYMQNGKLFILDNDKNSILVPGDFSEMEPSDYLEGTYQSNINFGNVYFYYELDGKIFLVISKDLNNNDWNTKELTSKIIGIPENSKIKYIRISGTYGYIFYITPKGDGKVLKSTTEGNYWYESNPDCILNDDCELKFLNEYGMTVNGFLTVPSEDGEKCDLYIVDNNYEQTFKKLDFASLYDSAKDLDYYHMPKLEKSSIYTISVKVGEKKDDTDVVEFCSSDGGNNWLDKNAYENKIQDSKLQQEKIKLSYDELIDNLDSNIFLKDFKNYNIDNNEIKITEEKAKEIAEIGFKESAKRIALEGIIDTSNEFMKIEEVNANNYFTRKLTQGDSMYTDIKRNAYVFTKENEMGNGVSVYVDVTTGLIIGGEAFGD